ncbi:hypothetical protein O988_01113 [Pseudogymnoascus sp. VKM F-3808]|nr:hypothetical protein O988_01113 [Pseudogymnoascus sp. VKM F-3808]
MFRNRRTSQKPSDELYARFKANFGSVVGATSNIITASSQYSPDAVADPSNLAMPGFTQEWMKDLDSTPRAQHDAWPLTPSGLDPNSYTSSTDAKQIPECSTRGGAANTLYYSQAGDLHTPRAGLGTFGKPFSTLASEADVRDGTMIGVAPYPQDMPHSFQAYNGLALHVTQEQPQQSATSPHHGTGYETMGLDGSPMHDISRMGRMEISVQPQMTTDLLQQFKPKVAAQMPPSAERFRFRVVLDAPTAMIKSADEIPITYLNRGKVYSMLIVDTQPILPVPVGARYRTSLRISFEHEQHRQQPASCWQVWKEGYGSVEVPQQGGKLHAMEYVEAIQQAGSDDKRTHVELDTASFDGFSIVWTPGTTGLTECRLTVRFNFLSTDFSHSKGVKGAPVRLCAKTVALGQSTPHSAVASTEVAYCKVKLFRAHGAERKLSNDVMHVKNTMVKFKQRIALSEADMKGFGKRKRTVSMPKSAATQNAGSVPKRKHALSISSASSMSGHDPFEKGLEYPPPPWCRTGRPRSTTRRPAAEPSGNVPKHKRERSILSASSEGGLTPLKEDLHYKLQQQQDMLTSTRSVSILHLQIYTPSPYPARLGPSRKSTCTIARPGSDARACSATVPPAPPR